MGPGLAMSIVIVLSSQIRNPRVGFTAIDQCAKYVIPVHLS
ncbi:MAG TPA: hypothetical protein VFJ58_09905 [Armatimonadota bacterium]|nr:hypothetical protein [Armatimonadota bacterium]